MNIKSSEEDELNAEESVEDKDSFPFAKNDEIMIEQFDDSDSSSTNGGEIWADNQ